MFVKRIVETQFELNCFLDKHDTDLVFQMLLSVEESELETEFGIAFANNPVTVIPNRRSCYWNTRITHNVAFFTQKLRQSYLHATRQSTLLPILAINPHFLPLPSYLLLITCLRCFNHCYFLFMSDLLTLFIFTRDAFSSSALARQIIRHSSVQSTVLFIQRYISTTDLPQQKARYNCRLLSSTFILPCCPSTTDRFAQQSPSSKQFSCCLLLAFTDRACNIWQKLRSK